MCSAKRCAVSKDKVPIIKSKQWVCLVYIGYTCGLQVALHEAGNMQSDYEQACHFAGHDARTEWNSGDSHRKRLLLFG
jgi:hypothetical protein